MISANIPVMVLTDVIGDPSDVIMMAVPRTGRFVIIKSDSQYDLYVTQGEEPPVLLTDDLGQFFHVPDVLSDPDEDVVSEDFALRIMSTAMKTLSQL